MRNSWQREGTVNLTFHAIDIHQRQASHRPFPFLELSLSCSTLPKLLICFACLGNSLLPQTVDYQIAPPLLEEEPITS